MARRSKNKGNKGYPKSSETSRGQTSQKRGDVADNSKREPERVESSDSKEEVSESREPISSKAMNDPAWYMQYPELAVDSASIPYSQPLGTPIKLRQEDGFLYGKHGDGTHDIISDTQVFDNSVPGILSLCVKHSIGYSRDKSDAVNIAANALYTNVRFVNSGRKNYDPADLFMYCLTMAEMYSFIEWCKRLYGMAFVYSQTNKYLGKALIEANNVDTDNLVSNLANFRMFINTFINKVSSYAIPNGIPYFSRRVFMYSSVYTESDTGNIKDQLYQFIPAGFFNYGLDEVGAGELHFSLFGNTYTPGSGVVPSTGKMTVSQIINYAQRFLDYIAGDEDFGLMSGDILKAYDGNIITLSVLDPEYLIVPVYDLDVLRQFRNANIVPGLCMGTSSDFKYALNSSNDKFGRCGNISQSAATGNIICIEATQNLGTESIVTARMNKMLDLNSPAPTIADNLESSRLVNYGDWREVLPPTEGTQPTTTIVLHAGTEIPVYAKVTYIQCNRNTYNEIKHINITAPALTHDNNSTTYYTSDVTVITALNKFHYAPFFYVLFLDSTTDDAYYIGDISVVQNLDNYVTLAHETIQKLHDCALLSMFFAPGVAKVVSVTR